jgi:hypothetical protein
MAPHLMQTRAMLPVPPARRALSSRTREGNRTCHNAGKSQGVEGNMETIYGNIPLWLWPTRGRTTSIKGAQNVSAGLHESRARRVSRRLLLELPVGVIPWVARTAVSRSRRPAPGLTVYNTEDELPTRGDITIRMTCVAMSKLCSHGAHHSRFTLHLSSAVILRQLDQQTHSLPTRMNVFTDDLATSSRGSPVPGLGGSRSLGVYDLSRPTFKRLPSHTLGPEYRKPATTNLLSGGREGFIGMPVNRIYKSHDGC